MKRSRGKNKKYGRGKNNNKIIVRILCQKADEHKGAQVAGFRVT